MTEDEAKTKTCCGPKVLTASLLLGKTDQSLKPAMLCLGSACMGWRWVVTLEGPDHGYCGLAGPAGKYSVGKP